MKFAPEICRAPPALPGDGVAQDVPVDIFASERNWPAALIVAENTWSVCGLNVGAELLRACRASCLAFPWLMAAWPRRHSGDCLHRVRP